MTKKDLENVDAEGFGSAMLDSFTIDISHQEMERIIVELELLHKTQPAKWLPIQVRPVNPLNLPSYHRRRRTPDARDRSLTAMRPVTRRVSATCSPRSSDTRTWTSLRTRSRRRSRFSSPTYPTSRCDTPADISSSPTLSSMPRHNN